jgi:hypothetical protein
MRNANAIEIRIALLESRTDCVNGTIIKKLKRKLRALQNAAK